MSAAVILVGGFGTRLRPLTLSKPKPLVEFVNKPIISHQIDALIKVGVQHIILSVSYLPDQLQDYIDNEFKRVGVKISTSVETSPLDTAGPVGLAAKLISDSPGSNFFVLNCDVICQFPLVEMLRKHEDNNAEGTILVTKVSEPSRYGVVVYDSNTGQIQNFVEKPKNFISNRINAGVYIFDKRALSRFKAERMSMEKGVFPDMAKNKSLYAFELEGFWMDVGTPKDFLAGSRMFLKDCQSSVEYATAVKDCAQEGVNRMSSAIIGKESKIGPDVVIGANVKVGQGSRLHDCTIFDNTVIGDNCWISGSIIGWNCNIGCWVRIENTAVLGENVSIANEVYINGASVLPHKNISQSICRPDIIL